MSKRPREHWPGHSKQWAIGALSTVAAFTVVYGLAGGIVVTKHADTVWNEQVAATQARNNNAFWEEIAGTARPQGVPGQLARALRAQAARPGETVAQQLQGLTGFRALDNQFPNINSMTGANILSYQLYSCGNQTCYTYAGPLTWEAIAKTLAALHGDIKLVERRPPPTESIGTLSYTYYGYGFSIPVAIAAILAFTFFATARLRLRAARHRKIQADRAYYDALPEPAKRLFIIKRTLQSYLETQWDSTANQLLTRVTKDLDEIVKTRAQIEDTARWAEIESQINTNEVLGRAYAETLREITT